MMIEAENRYYQFNSGFLDAQTWEARKSGLQPLAKLPIFKLWRESFGANNHSADFLKLIDSFAEKDPTE